MGKDTHSVDFSTVDIKDTADATAVAVPVTAAPDGCEEDAKYAERRALLQEQKAVILQMCGQDKMPAPVEYHGLKENYQREPFGK